MRWIRVFLMAATLLGGAHAAAGGDPPPLSLEDSVRLALGASPAMLAADAELLAAQADRRRAGLVVPSNPRVTAVVESDRFFGDEGSREVDVEIAQELWAPGQRSARIAAADAGLAAAEANRAWTLSRLAGAAAAAHVRASALQRKQAILQELLDVLLRLDDASRLRQEAGDVSEFQRNQVRLDTAAGLAELAAMQGEVAAAMAELEILIGVRIDPGAAMTSRPPLQWSDLAARASVASIEDRGDVLAARSRLLRAEKLIVVERRERWPRPSILLGYGTERGTISGDDFTGFPFPDDDVKLREDDRSLSVGVEVAIPVFDRRRAEIMTAAAARMSAEADVALTRREAQADQRRLLEQGRALSLASEAVASAAGAAAANLGVLQRAWEAGELPLDEVLRERDRILRSMLAAEDVGAAFLDTQLRLAAAIGALDVFGIDSPDSPETEGIAP